MRRCDGEAAPATPAALWQPGGGERGGVLGYSSQSSPPSRVAAPMRLRKTSSRLASAPAPAPTPAGLQLGTVVHPGDLNPHHAAAYIPHPIAPHPAAPTHPAVRAVQAAAQAAVLRVRAGRGVQY